MADERPLPVARGAYDLSNLDDSVFPTSSGAPSGFAATTAASEPPKLPPSPVEEEGDAAAPEAASGTESNGVPADSAVEASTTETATVEETTADTSTAADKPSGPLPASSGTPPASEASPPPAAQPAALASPRGPGDASDAVPAPSSPPVPAAAASAAAAAAAAAAADEERPCRPSDGAALPSKTPNTLGGGSDIAAWEADPAEVEAKRAAAEAAAVAAEAALPWAERLAASPPASRRRAYEAAAAAAPDMPADLATALSSDAAAALCRMSADSNALCLEAGCVAIAAFLKAGGAAAAVVAPVAADVAWWLCTKGLLLSKPAGSAAAEEALCHLATARGKSAGSARAKAGSAGCPVVGPCLTLLRDTKRKRPLPAACRVLATAAGMGTRLHGTALKPNTKAKTRPGFPKPLVKASAVSEADVAAALPNLLMMVNTSPDVAEAAAALAAAMLSDAAAAQTRAAAEEALSAPKVAAGAGAETWAAATALVSSSAAGAATGGQAPPTRGGAAGQAGAAAPAAAEAPVSSAAAASKGVLGGTGSGPAASSRPTTAAAAAPAKPATSGSGPAFAAPANGTAAAAAAAAAFTPPALPAWKAAPEVNVSAAVAKAGLPEALRSAKWPVKDRGLSAAESACLNPDVSRIASCSELDEAAAVLAAAGVAGNHPVATCRSATLLAGIAMRVRAPFSGSATSALPVVLSRLKDKKRPVVAACAECATAMATFAMDLVDSMPLLAASASAHVKARNAAAAACVFTVLQSCLASSEASADSLFWPPRRRARVGEPDPISDAATLLRSGIEGSAVDVRVAAESAMAAAVSRCGRLASAAPGAGMSAMEAAAKHHALGPALKALESSQPKSYRRIEAAASGAGEGGLAAQDFTGASTLGSPGSGRGHASSASSAAPIGSAPPTPPKQPAASAAAAAAAAAAAGSAASSRLAAVAPPALPATSGASPGAVPAREAGAPPGAAGPATVASLAESTAASIAASAALGWSAPAAVRPSDELAETGPPLPSSSSAAEDVKAALPRVSLKDLDATKWQTKVATMRALADALAATAGAGAAADAALAASVVALLRGCTKDWKSLSNANFLVAVMEGTCSAALAAGGLSPELAAFPVPASAAGSGSAGSDVVPAPAFAAPLLEALPVPKSPAAAASVSAEGAGLSRTVAATVMDGLVCPKLKERRGGAEAAALALALAASVGPPFIAKRLVQAAAEARLPAVVAAATSAVARLIRAFGVSRLGSARDDVIDMALSERAGLGHAKPQIKDPALAVLMAIRAQAGPAATNRLLAARRSAASSGRAASGPLAPSELSEPVAKALEASLASLADVAPIIGTDASMEDAEARDGEGAASLAAPARIAARLAVTAAAAGAHGIGPCFVRPVADPAAKAILTRARAQQGPPGSSATSSVAGGSGPGSVAGASSSGGRHSGGAGSASDAALLAAASGGLDLPQQSVRALVNPSLLGDMGTLKPGPTDSAASKPWQKRDRAVQTVISALEEAGAGGIDLAAGPGGYTREVISALVLRLADTNANIKPKAARALALLAAGGGARPLLARHGKVLVPPLADLTGDKKAVVAKAALAALTALTASDFAFAAAAAAAGGTSASIDLDPATAQPAPATVEAMLAAIGPAPFKSKSAGAPLADWTAARLDAAADHGVPVPAAALQPAVVPAVLALGSKAPRSRAAASRLVTAMARFGAAAACRKVATALKQGVRMTIEGPLDRCIEAGEAMPVTAAGQQAAGTTPRSAGSGAASAASSTAAGTSGNAGHRAGSGSGFAATGGRGGGGGGGSSSATGAAAAAGEGLGGTTRRKRVARRGRASAAADGSADGPPPRSGAGLGATGGRGGRAAKSTGGMGATGGSLAGIAGLSGTGTVAASAAGDDDADSAFLLSLPTDCTDDAKLVRIRRSRRFAKDPAADEAVDALRGEWAASGAASRTLVEHMFARGDVAHQQQERALIALRDAVGSQPAAVIATSDLILRLAALRLASAKMNVQQAALALVSDFLLFLKEAGRPLDRAEAALVVPTVAAECGAKRAAVRSAFGAVLHSLVGVMGARSFGRLALPAVTDVRNLRSVADVLQAAATAMEEHGDDAGPKATLGKEGWRLVGRCLDSKDAELRDAALTAIRPLWREVRGDMALLQRLLAGSAGMSTKPAGILEGRAREWAKEDETAGPTSSASSAAEGAELSGTAASGSIRSSGQHRARVAQHSRAADRSSDHGVTVNVHGAQATSASAAPGRTPRTDDVSDVSAFLSDIEKWTAGITVAGSAAEATSSAPPTDVALPTDPAVVSGAVGFTADADADAGVSLAHLPSTPPPGAAGRARRRETTLHIGSNEIRRALARTRSDGAPPMEDRFGAVGSPGSVGSADSALKDDLLGSRLDLAQADQPAGARSVLGASTLGASTYAAARAVPVWLKDLHSDILSAAFLLERARRTGKHAAVADPTKYSRGLAALAKLTQRVEDASPSSAAAAAASGRRSASGADSPAAALARAGSMLVKAVTTLLVHAFGGAVRPVVKPASGTAACHRSAITSPARPRRPAGGIALPGMAPQPTPSRRDDVADAAGRPAELPEITFRSSGDGDDAFVTAAIGLLMPFFMQPALAQAVSDRSLNALLTECLLRMTDTSAKPAFLDALSRLVMRVVHRARRDASLCALVDLLARAQSPEAALVEAGGAAGVAPSPGGLAPARSPLAAVDPGMGRTVMPVRSMTSLARLVSRVANRERTNTTASPSKAGLGSAAGSGSAAGPYGGDFDIGALASSLHQFFETHAAELRVASVTASTSSPTGASGIAAGFDHVASSLDAAVAVAGLPPSPYAVSLPIQSCISLLRNMSRARPRELWAVVEAMTLSPTQAEALAQSTSQASPQNYGGSARQAAPPSLDGVSPLGRAAAEAGMPVTRQSPIRTLLLQTLTLEFGMDGLPPAARAACDASWTASEAAVRDYANRARWAVSCLRRLHEPGVASRELDDCRSMITAAVTELLDLEERAEGSAARLEAILAAVEAASGAEGHELIGTLAAKRVERFSDMASRPDPRLDQSTMPGQAVHSAVPAAPVSAHASAASPSRDARQALGGSASSPSAGVAHRAHFVASPQRQQSLAAADHTGAASPGAAGSPSDMDDVLARIYGGSKPPATIAAAGSAASPLPSAMQHAPAAAPVVAAPLPAPPAAEDKENAFRPGSAPKTASSGIPTPSRASVASAPVSTGAAAPASGVPAADAQATARGKGPSDIQARLANLRSRMSKTRAQATQ